MGAWQTAGDHERAEAEARHDRAEQWGHFTHRERLMEEYGLTPADLAADRDES